MSLHDVGAYSSRACSFICPTSTQQRPATIMLANAGLEAACSSSSTWFSLARTAWHVDSVIFKRTHYFEHSSETRAARMNASVDLGIVSHV
ncbi:hypothetical protein BD626DRAFT_497994 [Schizophyllum amplum]|uniref:Uncharacterized protein n=1 Tax=Schizophyllum amplum TaxID=97359 RepID=A0A550CCV5_9AGAR|nr:hypothetical protein BD626DRAFT_497994 [Auriculariopsis ampla]